jgi:copper chaperone NosL
MKKNLLRFLFLGIPVLLISCSHGPEPLQYGKDECYFCKMGFVDPRFGAEIVTKKGRVYKFDDLVCMIRYLKSGMITGQEIDQKVVLNYNKQNDFIDADKASYLISPAFQTPMNSNAGAFSSPGEAQKIQAEKQGNIVNWASLYDKVR